jgi:hypothetical protein
MPEPLDEFDRSLRDRISAAEARVRVSSTAPAGGTAAPGPSRWLRPALVLATAAVAVVLAVVVIGQLPDRTIGDATPSPSAWEGVSASVRNGDFVLTLSSPRSMWSTKDAIEITATLTYDGHEPEVEIGGGSGPVVFSLVQLEGGDAVLGGGQDLPCLRYQLEPEAPLVWPFQKAGGIADEPPFDLAFFQDPELHLPPGRWEVRAALHYGDAECGDPQQLEVSIVLDVLEAAGSPGPSAVATEPPVSSAVASPTPTIEPRTEWRTMDISEIVGRTVVDYAETQFSGISEARGILFVTGREAKSEPGIWWSTDGRDWHAADVPRAPDPYGFSVRKVVDAGSQFVAIADGGLAEGSGIFATAIYVSADGRTWRHADSIPAVESGGHGSLVRSGDRLFAIGASVWVSEDEGLTWTEHITQDEWGGRAFDAEARDNMIVAVGQAGTSDIVQLPGSAWVSTDSGGTWRRALAAERSVLGSATIMANGDLIVASGSEVWRSVDGGESWATSTAPTCCGGEVVSTPNGLLALMRVEAEPSRMAASTDGSVWSHAGAVPVPVRDAIWGTQFGLVAVGQVTVGFGPDVLP